MNNFLIGAGMFMAFIVLLAAIDCAPEIISAWRKK